MKKKDVSLLGVLMNVLLTMGIVSRSSAVIAESVHSGMDVSVGEEMEEIIREAARKEGIKISSLNTRKPGSVVSAELKVKLDPGYTVKKAPVIINSSRRG